MVRPFGRLRDRRLTNRVQGPHRRNELRGEAGKVLEPVERPGAEGSVCRVVVPSGFVSTLRLAQDGASSTNLGLGGP